jgi:hypothetical protein
VKRAAVVLVVAACWSNAPPPVVPVQPVVEPTKPIVPYVPPRRTAVAPMTEFEALQARVLASRDDMCACSDKQCTDQVMAEFMRWATEWSQAHPDREKQFSSDEQAQLNESVRALTECMSRVHSGGGLTP